MARRRTSRRRTSNKRWIQGAVSPSKKGALRKSLGAKKGKPIPVSKLRTAAKKPGKIGQRARFALNVRGLGKGRRKR